MDDPQREPARLRHFTDSDGVVHVSVDDDSAEEFAKKMGFMPGQLVWSADGTEPYDIVEVIKGAWASGEFQARYEHARGAK